MFSAYSSISGDVIVSLKVGPQYQKIESPVAENLMVGLAIGMSFEGF